MKFLTDLFAKKKPSERRRRRRASGATKERTGFVEAVDRWSFNWEIRKKLYRHLSAKIDNGVTLEVALADFKKRLERKKKTSQLKIIDDILRVMKDGTRADKAFSRWIPAMEASLFSSGFEDGKLPLALNIIVRVESSRRRIVNAFRGAGTRPLYMGAMLYLAFWTVGFYIAPMLQTTLPESQATGLGASLYVVAHIAQSPFLMALPVAVFGGWLGLQWSKPRWTGKWRLMAERHLSSYRLYRDLEGYAWTKSFVGLMKAGKSDVEALQFQMEHATPWLEERLHSVRRQLVDGASLYAALTNGGRRLSRGHGFEFPNPDIVEDIGSLDGFSDFEDRIEAVADEWAQELEEAAVSKAKTMGFVLDIAMYVVVIYLVMAVNSLQDQLSSVQRYF